MTTTKTKIEDHPDFGRFWRTMPKREYSETEKEAIRELVELVRQEEEEQDAVLREWLK